MAKPTKNTGSGANFLDKFLQKGEVRLDPESKNTIHNDKWDKEDFSAIREELRELSQAQKDLLGITATGMEAVEDTFYTLKKPVPKVKDDEDIRPSYMINRRVMGEAMELPAWDKLRVTSFGDEVTSALAAVDLEPKLEVIFDKLQEEQALAELLEQQMMEAQGLQEEIDDAEEQMAKIKAEGGAPGGDQEGEPNPQDAQEKAKEALKKLQQSMKETAEKLDSGLEEKMPETRRTLREALDEANDKQDDMENIQKSWGLDRGALNKLPAKRRIELAARINTERFRQLAKVFGSIMRLAIAQQSKKTLYAKTQVCDIHFGNDISHVLPTELTALLNPELHHEFYRKYLQRGLMQYKLEGEEKVAKGDIIYCDDGSGSMHGDPEIWAKAVGLALLNVARNQKRGFYGVHFGSPGEYATFDFKPNRVEYFYNGTTKVFDEIDGTIEYAELFFGGGTDFMTPLTVALAQLQEQHEKFGATKGDIVFATDGYCAVEDKWLEEFKKEQARLKFNVYGIIIGGSVEMEPLNTICDGKVFTVKQMTDGEAIQTVLGAV